MCTYEHTHTVHVYIVCMTGNVSVHARMLIMTHTCVILQACEQPMRHRDPEKCLSQDLGHVLHKRGHI